MLRNAAHALQACGQAPRWLRVPPHRHRLAKVLFRACIAILGFLGLRVLGFELCFERSMPKSQTLSPEALKKPSSPSTSRSKWEGLAPKDTAFWAQSRRLRPSGAPRHPPQRGVLWGLRRLRVQGLSCKRFWASGLRLLVGGGDVEIPSTMSSRSSQALSRASGGTSA